MKTNLRALSALLCIAIVPGCNQHPSSTDEIESPSKDAIASLVTYREKEKTYYNSRDLDGLLSVFSEEIKVGSVGQPILSGHDELRNFFETYWMNYEVAEIINVVDEDVADIGEHLVVWSRFTLRISQDIDDTPTIQHGRTLSVYEKDTSGQFVLWREAGLDGGPASKLPTTIGFSHDYQD